MKIIERNNEKIIFVGELRLIKYASGEVGFLDMENQTSFTLSLVETEAFRKLLCE